MLEPSTPAHRLTEAQVKQLLAPINTVRVKDDGKGHAHLPQHDVTAHLIRVFGFCNFDTEITSSELVYEAERTNSNGEPNGRWDACYRATARLTVRSADGIELAHYEDGATGDSKNQPSRADAHDHAYKTALSGAKKRAAVPLGDQFGLSLYNKGQTDAYVMRTLVNPYANHEGKDAQEGIAKPLSDGVDETTTGDEAEPNEGQQANLSKTVGHKRVAS